MNNENLPERMLRKAVDFANNVFGPGGPVKVKITTTEDTPDGPLTTEIEGNVVDGEFENTREQSDT